MNEKYIIQPAIIADTWLDLVKKIKEVSDFSKEIQIDVMDGILTNSKSFPYGIKKDEFYKFFLPEHNIVKYEVHLMVEDPLEVGLQFIKAGADNIVAQIEGFKNNQKVKDTLTQWKNAGAKKVGLSIMLDTNIGEIEEFLSYKYIDYIQIMSIARIGYQGENFNNMAIGRIKKLREKYPDLVISVDGGVSKDNILNLKDAGANIFSVGSAIIKSNNSKQSYNILVNLI